MSDVCFPWALVPEPTKADDDKWNCHANRTSLASRRSLEDADPRVRISGTENLFLNVLDDQHIGDDCHKSHAAVDNRCSQHHAWHCNRSIPDLTLRQRLLSLVV